MKATKLGPPKSASEGAERDREWKSTVPSQDGEVLQVTKDKIVAQLGSGRRQTYGLAGKAAYVRAGDRFTGGASIIAGVIARLAPLAAVVKTRKWDPVRKLTAPDAVDRYAAAKAITHRVTDGRREQAALLACLKGERDDRVALEMAASAARLQAEGGIEHVAATVWNHERADLRMEPCSFCPSSGPRRPRRS